MQHRFQVHFIQVFAVMVSLLVIAGCSSQSPVQQSPQPTQTQFQADLTSVNSDIKVTKAGNQATDLKPDELIKVETGDQIESDQQGRAILKIPDLFEVEVFRGTAVLLTNLKQESGGSTELKLNQIHGHTRVSLNEQSLIRATLTTDFATITTLQEGTEFMVCHAPGNLTCVDVLKGAVEVAGQGKKQIVKAGEATYVLKDNPPSGPICAPVEKFIAWQDQMRQDEHTPAIGDLVAKLPQQPCGAPTQQAVNLPGSEGMVKIGYGTYEVGRDPVDENHGGARTVALQNFWIDQYEVTNAQFQQYLDASHDQPPSIWPGKEKAPVRGVTWNQAVFYCTWVKKRLPTEAEWEAAGRGPGANPAIFPWGDNDPEAGGKINDLPRTDTYPVGSFAFDRSPFGVYDLAGNVLEWVGDPYDTVKEGYKILRGGHFGYIQDLAYRQEAQPEDPIFVQYAGFRCAADQVEEK